MADRYRIRTDATQAIAEAKAEYQVEANKDGIIDTNEAAILFLMDRAYLTSEVADEAQAIAMQALVRAEGPNKPLSQRHRSLGELLEAWIARGKASEGDDSAAIERASLQGDCNKAA